MQLQPQPDLHQQPAQTSSLGDLQQLFDEDITHGDQPPYSPTHPNTSSGSRPNSSTTTTPTTTSSDTDAPTTDRPVDTGEALKQITDLLTHLSKSLPDLIARSTPGVRTTRMQGSSSDHSEVRLPAQTRLHALAPQHTQPGLAFARTPSNVWLNPVTHTPRPILRQQHVRFADPVTQPSPVAQPMPASNNTPAPAQHTPHPLQQARTQQTAPSLTFAELQKACTHVPTWPSTIPEMTASRWLSLLRPYLTEACKSQCLKTILTLVFKDGGLAWVADLPDALTYDDFETLFTERWGDLGFQTKQGGGGAKRPALSPSGPNKTLAPPSQTPRLTAEEFERHRRLGLCFECHQPQGQHRHNCPRAPRGRGNSTDRQGKQHQPDRRDNTKFPRR